MQFRCCMGAFCNIYAVSAGKKFFIFQFKSVIWYITYGILLSEIDQKAGTFVTADENAGEDEG